ncbi:MAG: sugar ABC transporter permease [Ruminococcaceae bacterium]|nr:sugar ABC transporter permease [Oscillospiraceae bacterium]
MKFLKDVKANFPLLIMAAPCFIWFIIFHYLPMFGVIIAFKDYNYVDGIFGSPWVGFKNFEYLFNTSDAYIITRNTILYSVGGIFLGIILAVSLAIVFDMLGKTKVSRVNQTIVLLPHFLSWVVISYFVFGLLSVDKGVFNNIIKSFGGEAVNWYAEPKVWPFILIILSMWKNVGFNSIIYYSTIRGFDLEYYEAAKIDGATWWQTITKITIPMLKPTLVILFIMNMGSVLRSDFGLHYIITKNSGMLYSVTSTLDTYIYNGMTGLGDMGATAAAGFYQSIVGFAMVMFTNWVSKKVSKEISLF